MSREDIKECYELGLYSKLIRISITPSTSEDDFYYIQRSWIGINKPQVVIDSTKNHDNPTKEGLWILANYIVNQSFQFTPDQKMLLESPNYANCIATIYINQNKFNEALTVLQVPKQENDEIRFSRVFALLGIYRIDLAIEEAKEIKNDWLRLYASAYISVLKAPYNDDGENYESLADPEQAIIGLLDLKENLYSKYNEVPSLLYNLMANCYFAQGEPDKALEILSEAPNVPENIDITEINRTVANLNNPETDALSAKAMIAALPSNSYLKNLEEKVQDFDQTVTEIKGAQ